MAVITYTAKRQHAKKAYLVNANDIAASAAGGTFDSTVTDLSGLLAGEWVYVSGYVDAANNGWHQLSADSTANQIAVSSTLVDEAAGVDVIFQGYYHGDGQAYQLEFKLRQYDETPNIHSEESRSISLTVIESLYFGETTKHVVTTDLIQEVDRPYWQEFFASVRARETLTFDPDGTAAVPVTPVTATLEGGETWQRFKSMRKWFVSFTLEVV